ncbi:BF3164 family lipoprotein [Cecembia calidifontis]|jgi:hypothetical protein|uniref:TolB-like protein n=1 Tax=Cecembia calidifontis TaxID=1187080 RepID=A0A4Q7PAU6_9BACT|nr:BF3164 family lipoprotein [Cecembia calidifontis]RZS97087.1 TolB-like protein [Cecembia calidifontis]
MNKFILFIVLIFISCKDENPVNEKILTSKKIIFNELINPQKIFLKGDYIIVFERNGIPEDKAPIHLIDLIEFKYKTSCGKIGFGPGELPDAHNFDFGFNDSTFWVYSALDKKINEFSLFFYNDLALNQIKQSEQFYKVYSALFSEEEKFIGLQVDSPHRFIEFDILNGQEEGFGKLKNFTDLKIEDSFLLSQLNMGWFGSSQNKSIFAVAYNFFPVVEIFHKETQEFYYFIKDESFKPKFKIQGNTGNDFIFWDLNSPYQFRDIWITDKHIFALFGGYSENQIQKQSTVAKQVYKLSLKGELIEIYNLDRSINNFAVNNSEDLIIGLTTDENPGIAIFEINDNAVPK